MTLDALVMLSGALVAFLSVAGFPPSIYKPLFFILGIFTIALGIVVRRKRGEWETAMRKMGQDPRAPKVPDQQSAMSAPAHPVRNSPPQPEGRASPVRDKNAERSGDISRISNGASAGAISNGTHEETEGLV